MRRLRGDDGFRLVRVHRFTGCRIGARVVIATSHGPAALVIVVVPTQHQIDAIAIEQRQPGFAKAFIRAIAILG